MDFFNMSSLGTSVCNQDDSSSQRMEDFFYELMTGSIIFEDVAWLMTNGYINHVGRKGYKVGPCQFFGGVPPKI